MSWVGSSCVHWEAAKPSFIARLPGSDSGPRQHSHWVPLAAGLKTSSTLPLAVTLVIWIQQVAQVHQMPNLQKGMHHFWFCVHIWTCLGARNQIRLNYLQRFWLVSMHANRQCDLALSYTLRFVFCVIVLAVACVLSASACMHCQAWWWPTQ